MEYRRLGTTGVKLSVIGLGSWLTYGASVDSSTTRRCLEAALDSGINFFDTADVYGAGEAERLLGDVLRPVPRGRYVLATKCFFPVGNSPTERGLSRKHIFDACHASLRRLGTDYIDLYQCHRFDEETPLEETVRAISDLVRSGKVLYWGFSQWPAEAIDRVTELAGGGFDAPVSAQVRYSMLDRDVEASVVPACSRHGIGIVAYSPLAQGVLTGKYSGGAIPSGSRAATAETLPSIQWRLTPEALAKVDRLAVLAREMGVPLAQLALAWCLRLPMVASVITGASSADQIVANVQAAGLQLDARLLEQIDQALL